MSSGHYVSLCRKYMYLYIILHRYIFILYYSEVYCTLWTHRALVRVLSSKYRSKCLVCPFIVLSIIIWNSFVTFILFFIELYIFLHSPSFLSSPSTLSHDSHTTGDLMTANEYMFQSTRIWSLEEQCNIFLCVFTDLTIIFKVSYGILPTLSLNLMVNLDIRV